MSYEEFLQKLRETPRDWFLESLWPSIRRIQAGETSCRCPISELAGLPCTEITRSALQIGLNEHLQWEIGNAADYDDGRTPNIRRDLLLACGLAKPEAQS